MMQLFENPTTALGTAVVAIAAACAGVALLRRQQLLRATVRDVTREERAHLREQESMRRAMEALLQELERFAQQASAELDAKLVEIAAATAKVDERLTQLRQLATCGPSAAALEAVAETSAALEANETMAREQPAPPATDPAAELRREISALADEGASPPEIARRLGLLLGEVELVLNLRRAA